MKPRLRITGRVIAAGLALVVFMAAFVMLGFRLVVDPVVHREFAAFPGWVARHAVSGIDDPKALDRELAATRSEIHAEISVYDRSGTLVASNTTPALVAPPEAKAEALASATAVAIDRGTFVTRVEKAGVPVGYAVTIDHPPSLPTERVILVLAAALVLAGFASVPLARSVTRPILALEDAARRLGDGDLGARASLDRADEIGDLGRTFDEMAARIQAVVRAEKELLANVSHELRTPLSRIRVVLELASDGDPARAQRYLPEIATDLAELDRLVEDVLTTAKLDLEGGRVGERPMPMRLADIDVAALVEQSRSRFQGLYPERALAVDAVAALPALRGDPVLVRRVLDNLLDNAVKHAPLPAKVALAVARAGDEITLEVRDDGPGMSAEVAARAFEPFFRGDAARDRRTGGVGLGLSLARRIVEAHGGSVDLVTAPGEGTQVTVRLPVA